MIQVLIVVIALVIVAPLVIVFILGALTGVLNHLSGGK